MPVVSLFPQDEGPLAFAKPDGSQLLVPKHRLRPWVKLGSDYQSRQAVFDTGAPCTLLSKRAWVKLAARGEVNWVLHAPNETADRDLPKTELLGAPRQYRIGRVRVSLVDGNRDCDLGFVLALCLTTDSVAGAVSASVILGMCEVLNGRTVLVQASPDGAKWSAALMQP